jgi:hypothetical protein
MILAVVFLFHVIGFTAAYLRHRRPHYMVFAVAFTLLTVHHLWDVGPEASGWLRYPAWVLLGVGTYWSIHQRLKGRRLPPAHRGEPFAGR